MTSKSVHRQFPVGATVPLLAGSFDSSSKPFSTAPTAGSGSATTAGGGGGTVSGIPLVIGSISALVKCEPGVVNSATWGENYLYSRVSGQLFAAGAKAATLSPGTTSAPGRPSQLRSASSDQPDARRRRALGQTSRRPSTHGEAG